MHPLWAEIEQAADISRSAVVGVRKKVEQSETLASEKEREQMLSRCDEYLYDFDRTRQ